ncbi:MAG: hypothetical protein KIT58_03125 [Planctomycetota bacterium]|nr:hypothetical protein [Planctomycetota bacterium]
MGHKVRMTKADGLLRVVVDTAREVDVGDLVYQEADDARSFASLADQGTETANQAYVAERFLGVCAKGKVGTAAAGEALINRDPNAEYRFPCEEESFEVYDLVGAAENDAGNALLPQALAKVSDPARAIGYAARRGVDVTEVVARLGRLAVLEAVAARLQSGLSVGGTIAALISAGVADAAAYTKATDGVQTLLAAGDDARVVLIVAVVTEAFADAGGAQTTFAIGETDTANKFAATSKFTDATLGEVFVLAGTLSATKALIVTANDAGGAGTGALTVTAFAFPAEA